MPHLRFYGHDESLLEIHAPSLIAPLSELIGCPHDWITLELVSTRHLTRPPLPLVEILWFSRGQQTQDRVAEFLTGEITRWSGTSPTLVFIPLEKENYYEDGVHF